MVARTSGMPVGSDVRERLRAAQLAEAAAIAAVQKALAAEADARARLDAIILKHQAVLAKTTRAVHATQASLVGISGLERAAALLDVSRSVLRSAVKEITQDASVHVRSNKTPAATTVPTIAPTRT